MSKIVNASMPGGHIPPVRLGVKRKSDMKPARPPAPTGGVTTRFPSSGNVCDTPFGVSTKITRPGLITARRAAYMFNTSEHGPETAPLQPDWRRVLFDQYLCCLLYVSVNTMCQCGHSSRFRNSPNPFNPPQVHVMHGSQTPIGSQLHPSYRTWPANRAARRRPSFLEDPGPPPAPVAYA